MFADDLAEALFSLIGAAEGGSSVAWLNHEPDEPDTVLVITETQGREGEGTMENPGTSYDFPSAQILSRSKDDSVAKSLISDAYEILRSISPDSISGSGIHRYLSVTPVQSPFYLRADEKDRRFYVFNVEGHRALG